MNVKREKGCDFRVKQMMKTTNERKERLNRETNKQKVEKGMKNGIGKQKRWKRGEMNE